MKCTLKLIATALLPLILSSYSFPEKADKSNSIPNKPEDGARVEVTPPGFVWWRAGAKDELTYRITVYDKEGKEVISAETGLECRWKPSEILPAGDYTWIVDAFDRNGKKACSRKPAGFTIVEGAAQIPFPDIEAALRSVSQNHPRMFFTPETVNYINSHGSQYEAELANLERIVKAAMKKTTPKLTFHTYDGSTKQGWAKLRNAYKTEFLSYVGFYRNDVRALALEYVLHSDKECGSLARKHLLEVTEFPVDEGGPMITQQGNLDEMALVVAESCSWIYDWTYDLYSSEERKKIEDWFVRLNDRLLFRLSPLGRDYLTTGTDSHSGRIPAFLSSWAVCLAERPEAAEWLRSSVKLAMTNYPYWGGNDGGWAEGISYSSGYTSFMFVAFENLRRTTGINLLDMPFFRNYPYFLAWCASPVGDVTPFGDQELTSTKRYSTTLGSAMSFIANSRGDAELAWWSDLFAGDAAESVLGFHSILQNLIFRSVQGEKPASIPTSRIFKDVGIAAFHSCADVPEKDNMFLLKSSPYGSLSHSHSDQNSFVVMQGGKVLALPGAERYPIAEAPFHQYARSSAAHNTLLFGGRGQIRGDRSCHGGISRSAATEHLSYACGSAATAYEGVRKFDRHALMIHPSVVIILDEFELEKPEKVEWLFHAKEKLTIREDGFTSTNGNCRMDVQLYATEPFELNQTGEWPLNPKKGYEFVTSKDPEKQWHLTAGLPETKEGRILAVLSLDPAVRIRCTLGKQTGHYNISIRFPDGRKASVAVGKKPFKAKYGRESL